MQAIVRVSVLLLAACGVQAADRFDAAREAIRQRMIEGNIPAVSIAVSQKGRIVWEEGFGWADKENRIPATEHTMYSLASLTKPLTVTGLMTLVQAGKVDLDRPINDYLGDAKLKVWIGDERKVTVRSVVEHTSGLAGGSQFFYGDDRALTPSMDRTILRYGNVVRPSGEREEYSNLGYGVLDYVIERVSGRSYADYMRSNVFLPLGMTHSSIYIGPGLETHQAIRYDRTGQPIPSYTFAEPGAAAAYSSAHDLVRLGMFFLQHRLPDGRAILNDASLAQMLQKTALAEGTSRGNVGWQVRKNGRNLVYGHAGSMDGVTTDLSMLPSQDICVVVLTNASIGSKLYAIRDVLFQSVSSDWQPMPPRAAPAAVAPFKPTPELVGAWSGDIHTYEGKQPIRLQFLATGDVHVQVGTQLETLLNKVKFDNGRLTGSTLSQIETSDTQRHPHNVDLALTLRGDVLNGVAAADSLPEPRVTWIYSLPYWVELRKVSP